MPPNRLPEVDEAEEDDDPFDEELPFDPEEDPEEVPEDSDVDLPEAASYRRARVFFPASPSSSSFFARWKAMTARRV